MRGTQSTGSEHGSAAAVLGGGDAVCSLLQQSAAFASVGGRDLPRLLLHATFRQLGEGEPLYQSGEPARHVYLVVEGQVEASQGARRGRGEALGEEAAVGLPTYLDSAAAATAARVAEFPGPLVRELSGGGSGYEPLERLHRDLLQRVCGERGAATSSIRAPQAEAGGKRNAQSLVQSDRAEPTVAACSSAARRAARYGPALAWGLSLAAFFLVLRARDTTLSDGAWGQAQLAATLGAAGVMWVLGIAPPYVVGLFVSTFSVALGVAPPASAFSGFASTPFFMAFSVFALGAVLVSSGVVTRAALWLVCRLPPRSVAVDLWALCLGLWLCPFVCSSEQRRRSLAPIAADAASLLRLTPGGSDCERLRHGVDAGARWFGPLILTAGPFNMILYGCLPEQLQHAFTWVEWLEGSVLILAVLLIGGLWALRRTFPSQAPPRPQRDLLSLSRSARGGVTAAEVFAVLGCALFLVALCSAEKHNVHPQLIALGLVTGYFALSVLGTEQINLDIDWKALLLLGFVTSGVQMMEDTGLAGQLFGRSSVDARASGSLAGLLGGGVVGLGALAALTLAARRFVPAVGVLVGAVAVVVCVHLGLHPFAFCFAALLFGDPPQAFSDPRVRRLERLGWGLRALGLLVTLPYWHALHLL